MPALPFGSLTRRYVLIIAANMPPRQSFPVAAQVQLQRNAGDRFGFLSVLLRAIARTGDLH